MQDVSSFADAITGAPIPAATVTALINRQLGPVQVTCKVRVCDTTLQPVPDAVPGNTADTSDMSPFIAPDAVVSHDTSQPVKRSFSFSMLDPTLLPGLGVSGLPFNPARHFLQVFQILAAGGVTLQASLGFFNMLMPAAAIDPGKVLYAWKGQDCTSIIAQNELLSDWSIPAGYTGGCRQAIIDALSGDTVSIAHGGKGQTPQGNPDAGCGIPASLIDIPLSVNQPVNVAQLFNAGTKRLDMVDQLCDLMNCVPMWQREDGKFTTMQDPAYSSAIPPAGWDYSTAPETSIISGTVSQEFSSQADSRICNHVKVVSAPTTTGGVDLVSEIENNDPSSFVSTVNMRSMNGGPRTIPIYVRQDGLQNQQMVDLYAKLLLQRGATLPEKLTLQSMHNPLHQDNDILICAITLASGESVVPSSATAPFRETSWSLPLKAAGAKMTHVLERVIAL